MPSRSDWGARLAAICVAVAACMAVRAQEPPTPAIEEVEGHLESTREIELQKSSPQAVDVSAGSGGAIFSPFTHVEKRESARRTVEVQGERGKDSDSNTTLIVALACGAGLGILFLAMRGRT